MMLNFSDELKDVKDVWSGKTVLKMIEGDAANNPIVSIANAYVTTGTGKCMKALFGESYSSISTGLSLSSDFMRYAAQMEMANGNAEYEAAATLLFGLKTFNTLFTGAVLKATPIPPIFHPLIKWGIGQLLNMADNYLMDCMRNNRHFLQPGHLRFIIDPSGVVFEAVIGNPVEGATMTVYFKDAETGEEVKWNAEDYDQINPLLTDKEGKYLWDVPEGEWKVVCEKDGYESAESEWMTIPPVRTEVNFQIVSKAAPEIVSAEAGENGVTVKLSKFADISTVTSKSLVLEGVTDAYTVSPVLVNEGDKYADTFVLSGKSVASATGVTVTETVKSYAGTAAKKATFNMTAAQEIHYGDVNDDGSVDLKDVVMMRRALAGGWELSINEAAADVNKDGSFDLKDVVILRRYLAGGWDLAVG